MLVFSGDWHRKYDNVIRDIDARKLTDCNLFQVGDFGIGMRGKTIELDRIDKELQVMNNLNNVLKDRNIILYVIRGNHDDPSFFDGSVLLSNVKLLPDYTVLNLDGKNILCVGGAISIDRKANPEQKDLKGEPWSGRFEGIDYWSNEAFVLDPEKLKGLNNINIVITHSAPDFCEPRIKHGLSGWAKYDLGLIEVCAKERNDLSKMYDILKANGSPLELWLYGHFHFDKREYFDDTQFILLGINQFYEYR